MLNKTEKSIMAVIYEKCAYKGSCLISIEEIKLKTKQRGLSEGKIRSVLKSLELDNYYELTRCDKCGEEFFCINLLAKGSAYKRETEQQKRAFVYKIFIAIITALITYAVGRILFLLF